MSKDEKVVTINVKLKSFFRNWVQFTQPFHKLRPQEQHLLSLLLFHHYRLRQEITNNKILWKELFDYDTKLSMYEEMEIQSGALENLLSSLRKKKVILDGQISPVYIPEITKSTKKFTLTFNFNIIHE
jgi:hypothetical protein